MIGPSTSVRPCGCGKPKKASAAVMCVLVWAPSLKRPAVLIPDDLWSLCLHETCSACLVFVARAVAAHPETKSVGDTWTMARIMFDDGVAAQIDRTAPAGTARA